MHLLLVISSLGGGGAERVIVRLAEAWTAHGVHVTVATFAPSESDFYPLPPGVARRSMPDDARGVRSLWPGPIARVRWLRTVMREVAPHAVISFTDRTNVVALLASRGWGLPVLVSERIDPEMYSPGRLWAVLRRMVYPLATTIVVQTRKIQRWSERLFPRVRTRVIPNPAPVELPPFSGTTQPTILAVGRFGPQKGFDVLIDAFAQIAPRHPEWQLRILGDGELRPQLEQQIERQCLAGRVELPGRCHNVLEQLAAAGLFVLSSRFEGFPNVLVEAMACGRAVVSTNCSSGPADLIEPGQNGILVPVDDAAALAAAMEELIDDPLLRAKLGHSAAEIRERLSMATILQMWNNALAESGCRLPESSESTSQVSRAA